jgi:hypothetical protein
MKEDLELTMKVRNNLLKRRRLPVKKYEALLAAFASGRTEILSEVVTAEDLRKALGGAKQAGWVDDDLNSYGVFKKFEDAQVEASKAMKSVAVPGGGHKIEYNVPNSVLIALSVILQLGREVLFDEIKGDETVRAVAGCFALCLVFGAKHSYLRKVSLADWFIDEFYDDASNNKEALSSRSYLFGRLLLGWADSGYVQVEVPHKTAAALVFTDPDPTFIPPWNCFVVSVPEGVLETPAAKVIGDVRYIWFQKMPEGEPNEYKTTDGYRMIIVDGEAKSLVSFATSLADPMPAKTLLEQGMVHTKPEAVGLTRLVKSCLNLVCGVCVLKTEGQGARITQRATTHKASNGKQRPLDLPTRTVVQVTHTIDLDLRPQVREWIHATTTGHRPTVHFVVCGHFTNQPHGPKSSLRKRIWIKPYWKGNKEAVVLAKKYKFKDALEPQEEIRELLEEHRKEEV